MKLRPAKKDKQETKEVVVDGKKYLRMNGMLIPIMNENGEHADALPDDTIN